MVILMAKALQMGGGSASAGGATVVASLPALGAGQ